ncbi:MAG: NAD(P)H-dependent oxidoreductase [Alphaproteobacteria bacterium]|nr:NAD(P)H-dependent oxidoreductase [Alphaproteobacteria bacterium]
MNDGKRDGIRIVAVLGTARPGNYTARALALVTDEIEKRGDIALDVIDPAGMDLPFPGTDPDAPDAKALQEMVSRATGVVFSTPEYHGTYSAMTKLILENLGFPSVLAGKPVGLLGVAAGQIGAIKALEHLRSVLSHIGAIVLPGPVSVAGVQQVFDEDGRCLDERMEGLIRGVATNLIDYIHSNICPRVALEQFVRGEAERRIA